MVRRANDVSWSAREVLKELKDMQQILAGMNELNESVQNAEAPATETERQAQATQQDLIRSQAGVKGKVKGVRRATIFSPFLPLALCCLVLM